MINKFTKILSLGAVALGTFAGFARAADTVKVGVLHSLSGTMAISETSLRDVLLFTFDEINAKGGVLGRPLELVARDDEANPSKGVLATRELIQRVGVVAVVVVGDHALGGHARVDPPRGIAMPLGRRFRP